MPRQMPKNGMPRSRAKRIASTLPSMPRSPKPPGTSNAVEAGQQPLGPFVLDRFALNALDANLGPMGDAGVVERLVDRFVGVAVLGVFADHGDR